MLKESEKDIIRSIGYGNMNAIELPSSLNNEGLWPVNDINAYQLIYKEGQKISSISKLMEAYSPDFIFIFNWKDHDELFSGINLQSYDDLYFDEDDKKISVLKIQGTNTKIIWTAHPSWLRRKGYSNDDIVELLYQSFCSARNRE